MRVKRAEEIGLGEEFERGRGVRQRESFKTEFAGYLSKEFCSPDRWSVRTSVGVTPFKDVYRFQNTLYRVSLL